MSAFQRIIVGVDLSETANSPEWSIGPNVSAAINQAIELAHFGAREVIFLTIIDVPSGFAPGHQEEDANSLEALREKAFRSLSECLERTTATGADATIELSCGRPWTELIRSAIQHSADLVLIGTKDRSRLSQALFGSTGQKLLRYCPVPVWVSRPVDDSADENESEACSTVMVATDLSDWSERLIQVGVELAQLQEARLLVLHSIEHHTNLRLRFSDLDDDEVQRRHDAMVDAAEQTLHSHLKFTDYRTLQWGMQIQIVDGPADQEILEAINQHDVDLLIMGTVARSGFAGILVGNTAERLLPEIDCSLMAFKPPGFQCPVDLDA